MANSPDKYYPPAVSLGVLIVNGGPPVRETIKSRLQSTPGWSFRFAEAVDVDEAFRKLQEQVYDLVVLAGSPSDPNNLKGLAFLQQIRQIHPRSAAIMLTGESHPQLTVAAMRMGAMDILQKDDLPHCDFAPILHRLVEIRDLLNQNMELRQANQMKSLFISNVSRELRTPLTVILGYVRVLQDGTLGGMTADQLKAVASVAGGAEDLLGMINRILRVNEIVEGRQAAAFKPADLREVCRSSADKAKLSMDLQAKRLRLECACSDAPVPIQADVAALAEVLNILLVNAVKFSPERGLIRVAAGAADGRAWATVADQGAGIAAEVLPHIFEDFSAAALHGSPSSMRPRSGLGLSLAKQTMVLHSGNIWLESPGPGQGCTAHVSLPLVREPAAEPAVPAAPPAGKKLILLVEDNSDIVDIIGLFIASLGGDIELIPARSGFEALDILGRQLPHLILLDIMMPGMSGLDLIERLKSTPRTSRVPILVLTGYADAAARAKAMGGNEVLIKPFDHATFIKKIVELLALGSSAAPPV
ncbi:MAG: response regulator [Elusimicrobia bacterium]|nr:response regulator [Elusimicrobiota bacterium]